MKRSSFRVAACVMLLAVLETAAMSLPLGVSLGRAATHDLTADWSDVANPNGVWTYREGIRALPFIAHWTPVSGYVQPAWAPSSVGGRFLPAWLRSTRDKLGGSLDLLTGDVIVHTTDAANGQSSGIANVAWTSPVDGVVDVSGSLWMTRDIDRANTWTLLLRGVPITSGQIASGDAFSRSNPFDFARGSGGSSALTGLAVSVGDVIELRLVKTSTFGDFVGVTLRITTSPLTDPPVGAVSGGAQATFQGKVLPVVPGFRLMQGMEVTTGAGGQVAGVCDDGRSFSLEAKASLFLDGPLCPQAGSTAAAGVLAAGPAVEAPGASFLDLTQGELKFATAGGQSRNPSVRTPISQSDVGSAGADFSTAYSVGQAVTTVQRGSVTVTNVVTGVVSIATPGHAVITNLPPTFSPTGTVVPQVVASVLPSSRSVQVGVAATAFATILNAGSSRALVCQIAPVTSVPATFTFQTTDSVNRIVGQPQTPISIPATSGQPFVIAFTPTAPFQPTEVQLSFKCGGASEGASVAPLLVGVNTLLLSASATPVPDIVALAATVTPGLIVDLPAAGGVFVVATVNVGAGGSITVSADTGSTSLPIAIALCQTNPVTGSCLGTPASGVTTTIGANATPTFGIFVTGSGQVPFDPARNRIFVRFKDAGGVTRGSTSVAVRTP